MALTLGAQGKVDNLRSEFDADFKEMAEKAKANLQKAIKEEQDKHPAWTSDDVRNAYLSAVERHPYCLGLKKLLSELGIALKGAKAEASE